MALIGGQQTYTKAEDAAWEYHFAQRAKAKKNRERAYNKMVKAFEEDLKRWK
jgi:hypothetical protein